MRSYSNVALIDHNAPANNTFYFNEEVNFEDRDRRWLDMVLYINGLPVVLIENKSPKLQAPGRKGFEQVQDIYTTNIPEFIKYSVPFAICAARLEYGVRNWTWSSPACKYARCATSGAASQPSAR